MWVTVFQIKLYLQKYTVGQTWPVCRGRPTPAFLGGLETQSVDVGTWAGPDTKQVWDKLYV